tara:strand:+ start:5388 stop:6869 length:1482 start_codon:yes stop_codon:yes gene_type:complete
MVGKSCNICNCKIKSSQSLYNYYHNNNIICYSCYNKFKKNNEKDLIKIKKITPKTKDSNSNDSNSKDSNSKDSNSNDSNSKGSNSEDSNSDNNQITFNDIFEELFNVNNIRSIEIVNSLDNPIYYNHPNPNKRRRRTDDENNNHKIDNCDKPNKKLKYDITLDKEYKNYPFKWLGKIGSIDDLIKLGKSYDPNIKIKNNLNKYKLYRLVEPLEELQQMVGLDKIKNTIFDQITYYLQELDIKSNEMLHTVIAGPPGVGKTKLAYILGKIYNRLGFLKTDKIISVKRNDLVAGYLGQSAIKTKKKLDEALGGVLFIDEAYSLGNSCRDDSYSKEVIDILTAYLSEHPNELVCIIAGYKNALENRFFSQNEGLSRRFTHRYYIDDYTSKELSEIFIHLINKQKWSIDANTNDKLNNFFNVNLKLFPNYGGDIETFINCCKKSHSKRLLNISTEKELSESKKNINYKDMENGLEILKFIRDINKEDLNNYQHHLYI